MPIINCAQEIVMDLTTEMLVHAAPLLARASPLRHAAIWAGEKYIHLARKGDSTNTPLPPGVIADRAEFGEAILHTADRMLASGLSPTVIRRLADNLVRGIAIEGGGQSAISRFFEAQGTYPPGFMTLSPEKSCNLRCTGCYASAGPTAEKLDWVTFDRIITEAKTLWGVRFLVISGGEPVSLPLRGERHPGGCREAPRCIFHDVHQRHAHHGGSRGADGGSGESQSGHLVRGLAGTHR